VAAYLIKSGQVSGAADAVAAIRAARPAVRIRPEIAGALDRFACAFREGNARDVFLLASADAARS
jgi:hypothetical protein